MERSRHERIVFHCVAEDDELGIADTHAIFGKFCRFPDFLPHEADSIHIDAGFRRADIDGRADHVCFGKGSWNAFDQFQIALTGTSLFFSSRGITVDDMYRIAPSPIFAGKEESTEKFFNAFLPGSAFFFISIG